MTDLCVSLVDVYLVRGRAESLEILALRRARGGRCPGSWETVHGHIESGERPDQAALREAAEETGLVPERLYNLSRVELFYEHGPDRVALVPVFVAWVSLEASVTLSPEHDRAEWLPLDQARSRFAWPRERRALQDIASLLAGGDGGAVDDVLRVR